MSDTDGKGDNLTAVLKAMHDSLAKRFDIAVTNLRGEITREAVHITPEVIGPDVHVSNNVSPAAVTVTAPTVNNIVQPAIVQNTVNIDALSKMLTRATDNMANAVIHMADAIAESNILMSQLIQVMSEQKRPIVKYTPPTQPIQPKAPRTAEITHANGDKSIVTIS